MHQSMHIELSYLVNIDAIYVIVKRSCKMIWCIIKVYNTLYRDHYDNIRKNFKQKRQDVHFFMQLEIGGG
jgi:hypothetical protein